MSGGHFDYAQHKIRDIAESIELEIRRNGKKKSNYELNDEILGDTDWYDKYPEDLYHYKYPYAVIDKFKKAVYYLKIAEVYAQRVDWLLSGDDGEDSFLERLKEELSKIKKI